MSRLMPLIVALLFVTQTSHAHSEGKAPIEAERPIISTEAELESVIARLADEQTRLAAIERLFKLHRYRGNWTSSGGFGPVDPLVEKAKTALEPHSNLVMAEQAMRSSSATVRVWGLNRLSNLDEATLERWQHLVPLVRELAVDPSINVRSNAQRVLKSQPGQRDFLANLIETETYAGNVMHLIGYGSELDWRMNRELLRLLNHPNIEARESAMLNIGFNSNRAEVWQIHYSERVVDRVFELTRSPLESDRAAAVYALDDLQARYPDRVRNSMLELANDHAVEVRWRIPYVLRPDRERPEVREALERLAQDESAQVQLNAILALGVEDYVPKLRQLSADPDWKTARRAQQKLMQLRESP